MAATEPLYKILNIYPSSLLKQEILLLEAELLIKVCNELLVFFKEINKDYFHLLKLTKEKENAVLENKFVRLIIQDILCTNEYNIDGIACYTNTPAEVVSEVLAGLNIHPSASFLRRIIDLHRSVRAELYNMIGKKIAQEYLACE